MSMYLPELTEAEIVLLMAFKAGKTYELGTENHPFSSRAHRDIRQSRKLFDRRFMERVENHYVRLTELREEKQLMVIMEVEADIKAKQIAIRQFRKQGFILPAPAKK